MSNLISDCFMIKADGAIVESASKQNDLIQEFGRLCRETEKDVQIVRVKVTEGVCMDRKLYERVMEFYKDKPDVA